MNLMEKQERKIKGLSEEQEANMAAIAGSMGPQLSPDANEALGKTIADQIRQNVFDKTLKDMQELDALEQSDLLEKSESEVERKQGQLLEEFDKRRELETRSTRDGLTGLLDKKGYYQEIEKLVARLVQPGQPKIKEGAVEHVSILVVDVDDFKVINDTYGHSVGDIVLKEVAHRLKEYMLFGKPLRPTDIAARWGGEEFVFVFEGVTEQEAKILLTDPKTKELRKLSTVIDIGDDKQLTVTASGGLAEYIPGESFPEATFNRADAHMYLSKKSPGKNRITTTKSKTSHAS